MKKAKQEGTITPWEALHRELTDRYARTAERWDLARIITTAHERGITVTWDDLRDQWALRRGGGMVMPGFVTAFMAAYAVKRKPKSVLDGWSGLGSVLIPVVEAVMPDSATG